MPDLTQFGKCIFILIFNILMHEVGWVILFIFLLENFRSAKTERAFSENR